MKRIINITLLVMLISITVFPVVSYAWGFGDSKDVLLDKGVEWLIISFFTVLGGLFGGNIWTKRIMLAKAPLIEANHVRREIKKARRASSPGGKTITKEELDVILREASDVIEVTVGILGGKNED